MVKQIKARVGLLLTGAYTVFYGLTMYRKYGVFPYAAWQHQPVFPVGVVIIGFIVMATAFTPPPSWVNRLFGREERKPEAHVLELLHEHRHKNKANG